MNIAVYAFGALLLGSTSYEASTRPDMFVKSRLNAQFDTLSDYIKDDNAPFTMTLLSWAHLNPFQLLYGPAELFKPERLSSVV